jgi:hypothetical protein
VEAPAIPLFRWSGAYFGFLLSGWLFDAYGRYLGWYDERGAVWARDGTYLGEIVEASYVLRRLTVSPPVRRTPKVPPVSPPLPSAPANRVPRVTLSGWADALDRVGLRPGREDLFGCWENDDHRLLLRGDLTYALVGGAPEERGTWGLRGNLILDPDAEPGEEPPNRVYAILEYDVETITLRRVSFEERTLALTLRRTAPAPD